MLVFGSGGGSVPLEFFLALSDYFFCPRRGIWRGGGVVFISLGDCPSSLSFTLVVSLGLGGGGSSEHIDLSISLSRLFV